MKGKTTTDLQHKEVASGGKCLNCGADLQGAYCHVCGQAATHKKPTVSWFVAEYFYNAFIWDSKCLHTIWKLISRPGHLTNAFNAGKYVAYEHPLKLNMFFLFVFVTIFMFFSDIDKSSNLINETVQEEIVRPHLTLDALSEDFGYSVKMNSCDKDTILLSMPLSLADEFPQVITVIDKVTDYGGEILDTVVVAVPEVLIQDDILIENTPGTYSFSPHNKLVDEMLELESISELWRQSLDIISSYFPLIFLLTSPLLAFAIKLLHPRWKQPFISFFIFALHYTAFVELILLLIYILYLTIHPGLETLELIVSLTSCTYLTIAIRNVFKGTTWVKSTVKALMVSFIYQLICFTAFLAIFIVTLFCILLNQEIA